MACVVVVAAASRLVAVDRSGLAVADNRVAGPDRGLVASRAVDTDLVVAVAYNSSQIIYFLVELLV